MPSRLRSITRRCRAAKRLGPRANHTCHRLRFEPLEDRALLSGTPWLEEAKLIAGDAASGNKFGYSVSISGDTILVGATGHGGFFHRSPGSAYVFVSDGSGGWTQKAKLTGASTSEGFGHSVSISGDTIVVGDYRDDDAGYGSGAAYVFVPDGSGGWIQQAKLTASDAATSDFFGHSVSISGDTIVVGANYSDGAGINSGSAYVFVPNGSGGWTQQAKLTASDAANYDYFGHSVSISGDTIVVGAIYGDSAGISSGSAYVFVPDGSGGWTQQTKLTASDGAKWDDFGRSVSISGDTIVVGATGDDDAADSSGSAYVFVPDGSGGWTQQTKLTASDGAFYDYFGLSVSISGDTILVGAPGVGGISADSSGSTYVFVPDGSGGWTQQTKLTASDGANLDYFGHSASISGDTIVVGAYGDDIGGSAYVFATDTTPPILTLPTGVTAEATGPEGAAVSFTTLAVDAVDGELPVSCDAPPVFPLGMTLVTCEATDNAGNTAVGSFNVTVQDTTPPILTLPTSVTAEATGPEGAAVSFTTLAVDAVDGELPVSCDAPPVFPLGMTLVTCEATDNAGSTAVGSFNVTVQDTTPPILTLPTSVTAEATGPEGAAVSFTTLAVDTVDGELPVSCDGPPVFPLGMTLVTCEATDSAGNTAVGSLNVTVQDTKPPETTIDSARDGDEADLFLDSTTLSDAITVTFSGNDLVWLDVTAFECRLDQGAFSSCASPTSYSGLPEGFHSFEVRAIDGAGNADPSPAVFNWEIQTPILAIEELVATVSDFDLHAGLENSLIAKLDAALGALGDENPANDVAATNVLNAFINAVEAGRGKKITDEQADQLIDEVLGIIDALEESI